jgi:hypothetical protein
MLLPHGGHPSDISYDGRVFQSTAAETTAADGSGVIGHYHQDGAVVWGEFTGGRVVRGSIMGRSDDGGVLHLAYCQLLDDGSVMSGACTSYPTVHADGRVLLEEHWERFGEHADTGISVLEEPASAKE